MQKDNSECKWKTLQARFDKHKGKQIQYLMIKQFVIQELLNISKNVQYLIKKDNKFEKNWELVKQRADKNENNDDQKEIKDAYYYVLSSYNLNIRLKKTLQQLRQLQQKNINKILPPPSPCQYVDTSLWTTQDQAQNKNNWIGHGYYWKTGDGVTKDNYNGDYNTLEDKFFRIKSAKVLMADYQLLKKDFPLLLGKDQAEIDQWLLSQTAFLSQGQVSRIKLGGDIHEQLDITQEQIQKQFINFSKPKCGIRYRGGGRAVNFIIDDKYAIQNGHFVSENINVKGVGSQKIITGFGVKENGLLSMADAIKQYCFQKLLQKICEKQKINCSTIQTYGFIDIGLRYKQQIESPATGYKGDRLALTVRQASSRFQSSYDEMCYYSVVPEQLQNQQLCREFRSALLKWGVTSQQQPLAIFNQKQNDVNNLFGSWNIQADATMSKFIDFSQFYVLPNSKLPKCWKMSQQALLEGIVANKFAYKKLEKNQNLMNKYFKTTYQQQLSKIHQKLLEIVKTKYGDTVGKMRKPKYSWSWFLETDDSQVSKFAFNYRLNQKLSKELMKDKISNWLNF